MAELKLSITERNRRFCINYLYCINRNDLTDVTDLILSSQLRMKGLQFSLTCFFMTVSIKGSAFLFTLVWTHPTLSRWFVDHRVETWTLRFMSFQSLRKPPFIAIEIKLHLVAPWLYFVSFVKWRANSFSHKRESEGGRHHNHNMAPGCFLSLFHNKILSSNCCRGCTEMNSDFIFWLICKLESDSLYISTKC